MKTKMYEVDVVHTQYSVAKVRVRARSETEAARDGDFEVIGTEEV